MAAMGELARARTELKHWLLRGVKGPRADERAQELIYEHQSTVKRVLAHLLADQLREAGGHLGHNTNLAYRRAADLIDPEVRT